MNEKLSVAERLILLERWTHNHDKICNWRFCGMIITVAIGFAGLVLAVSFK